jgi:hypothetical protein
MTTWPRLAVTLAALMALLALAAAPAAAHERRSAGRYGIEVGFGDEPAYAGTRNSVQVLVTDPDGKPVTDLGDTLEVMVMAGGQQRTLPLEPGFDDDGGTPGDYRAWFVPSAPGRYAFHLSGAVKGQKVNQTFTSGPGSFSDVLDPATATFPATRSVSAAALAQRLDRELPRLTAATQSAQSALAASQAAERRARHQAEQARLVAAGGLAAGLLGLLLAGLALARTRRPAISRATMPRHLDQARARSLT